MLMQFSAHYYTHYSVSFYTLYGIGQGRLFFTNSERINYKEMILKATLL